MQVHDGVCYLLTSLGISILTTSEKILVNGHDFKALKPRTKETAGNQIFCAHLLSQFRKNLAGCEVRGLKMA